MVVEQRAAEFFEGRVLEVRPAELFVQPALHGKAITVAKSDAYRLPASTEGLAEGDWAVCNLRSAEWNACQIVAVTSDGFRARGAGAEHTLAVEGVLAPSPVTRLNVERYFARSAAQQGFAEAVQSAGSPARPTGWRASPRERVVARHDDGWYSGRVHEIEDDGLRIDWAVGGDATKVPTGHVVPEPPYDTALSRGGFALLRPSAPANPWKPVRIERIQGDEVTVVDADGSQTRATPSELIPLEK